MNIDIPYNKPFVFGNELGCIAEAIASGQLAGDGGFTGKCCRLLEERCGSHRVLLTPSCTAALEMAAMLLDIGPGDEVIVPSYTFVSTANGFVRSGATPVFVDVRSDTLNIDENLIDAAITPRTKAICPVHYAGVGCEMERIMAIAQQHALPVIEDAAQGVNAFYRGRALGSFGSLGTFSFHETKNYVSGEGGALCVNDAELVERAEILRDKGTDRQRFFRGEVDKYSWVDVGSSYVVSQLVSAFLYAQLSSFDEASRRRRRIVETYRQHLAPLADQGLLQLPFVPQHCATNFHMFYVLMPSERSRDALLDCLKRRGIQATFHYVPLHLSEVGRRLGRCSGELAVTEQIHGRLLRLPMYPSLSPDDVQSVTECVRSFVTECVSVRPAYEPSSDARTIPDDHGETTAPSTHGAAPQPPDVWLTPLSESHADNMLLWMQDPEVREHIGVRGEPSLDKTLDWIARANRIPEVCAFAIIKDNGHVGNVVLDQIDTYLQSARLSIFVGEGDLRGRGIGQAAIRQVLREAFRKLDLHKVWLTVHARNARAIRAYTNVGFRSEGLLRDEFWLNGKRESALRMGILAHEHRDEMAPPPVDAVTAMLKCLHNETDSRAADEPIAVAHTDETMRESHSSVIPHK